MEFHYHMDSYVIDLLDNDYFERDGNDHDDFDKFHVVR